VTAMATRIIVVATMIRAAVGGALRRRQRTARCSCRNRTRVLARATGAERAIGWRSGCG
jgi:hypothetical protein